MAVASCSSTMFSNLQQHIACEHDDVQRRWDPSVRHVGWMEIISILGSHAVHLGHHGQPAVRHITCHIHTWQSRQCVNPKSIDLCWLALGRAAKLIMRTSKSTEYDHSCIGLTCHFLAAEHGLSTVRTPRVHTCYA